MVNTSILSGVALATLINVVVVTASKKPLSLDTTVWTANDTNLIPEEEFDFDQGSSIAERKKCLATRQCTNAGGSCIKSRASCDGTEDRQGCKGKKCKCCIPNQTTTTTTCPSITCPSCPTIPDQTTTTTTFSSITCPSCPTIPDQTTTTTTCPSCPTIPECTTIPECPMIPECPTISPSTSTTLSTQDTTTTTVPVGFEEFHGRVIRRTISSDPKSHYDGCMSFCDQFGAKPFIPRTVADHTLYKTVRTTFGNSGYMWLPANDRLQEGTLRLYNGDLASNISLWDWGSGQELYDNGASRDCLFYGYTGGAPAVHMTGCTSFTSYPPICEII